MRKIIALEFITLDGVIQAGGGPQEDTSDGFPYGGWQVPYSDDIISSTMMRQMTLPFDLLLGRKTFDIWAPYWPNHGHIWPQANTVTKYVASNTLTQSDWQPTVFLNGDLPTLIRALKQADGPNLHIYGSADLLQTLFQHDLVDELWLKIYPLTLGTGKRLFAAGTIPAAFKMTASQITPSGIIIADYTRSGPITTGSY